MFTALRELLINLLVHMDTKTVWTSDELNRVKLSRKSDQASLSLTYVNIRVIVLFRTLSEMGEAWAGRAGPLSGHEGVIKPADGRTVEEIQGCPSVY